jgi:regulatory protein
MAEQRRMKPRQPPKPPTQERLEKAALHYLERYAASSEGVRRVLMRKVERAARAGVGDKVQGAADVAAVIDKLLARKLVDDSVFAEGRALSLARRGLPRSQIVQRLKIKGVDGEEVDKALAALDEAGISDRTAAILFAKRKRLGPFCTNAAVRKDQRLRHMAAMARAGFDGTLARMVLDAPNPEALGEG